MKRLITHILILSALVFASCRKPKALPEKEKTEPVFYIDCNVQGAQLHLEAGTNDYYMNSSYYEDSNHVYVFKGDLKQNNCGNCGYSIAFLIRDSEATPAGSTMNINRAVRPGYYLMSDKYEYSNFQKVSFKPLKSEAGECKWSFYEGTNSPLFVSSYTVPPMAFEVGKTYSVVLEYADAVGICSSTHTNVFTAGTPLQARIGCKRDSTVLDKFQYLFTSTITGADNYTCEWNMGDGGPGMTGKSGQYRFESIGTYITQLKVTDNKTGATCTSYYQMNVTDGKMCHANFSTIFEPLEYTLHPLRVTILLTDPSGKVYTSELSTQANDSNFEIVSVDEYQLNENHQKTKRVKIRFNCLIKDGNSVLKISDAEAVIAVAYK